MCEALQDKKDVPVQELALEKELLKEQMDMKKCNWSAVEEETRGVEDETRGPQSKT
jgi:hypothetical protein